MITSFVDPQKHVFNKDPERVRQSFLRSQDLYFTAGSRDSGIGQSIYQVLKMKVEIQYTLKAYNYTYKLYTSVNVL